METETTPTTSVDTSVADHRKPIHMLGLAIVLSLLAFVWLAYSGYGYYYLNQSVLEQEFQVKELKNTVARLDEGLTMTARLAAVTGKPRWEEQYHSYDPRLIEAPSSLAGNGAKPLLDANENQPHNILRAIEENVLAFAREGKLKEATALIFSPEYGEQKRIYGNKLALLGAMLEAKSRNAIQEAEEKASFQILLVIGATSILLLVWLYVWKTMKTWQLALREQDARLRALNISLDKEVTQYNRLIDGITNGTVGTIVGNDEDSSVFHVQSVDLFQENERVMKKLQLHNSELKNAMSNDREFGSDVAPLPESVQSPFFQRLTHEVRTPLAAIMAFTEALKDSEMPQELREEATEIVIRNSAQLQRVINNLTEVDKIDASSTGESSADFKDVSAETQILTPSEILLVEDFEDNQRFMKLWLRKMNVNVTAVYNGQEALDSVKSGCYDLILMDLAMPVMDGYTATKLIRDFGYEKPIIALSAHANEEAKDKAIEVGCNHFLSKPLDKQMFASVVQNYLLRSRKEEDTPRH